MSLYCKTGGKHF